MIRLLTALLLGLLPSPSSAETQPASTAGQFLVATPDLSDPNFDHTVVLMVEHDDQGAFGLVINRRIGMIPVQTLIESMGKEAEASEANVAVHIGGPVQGGAGFILHSPDTMLDDSKLVTPDIAVTSDPAMLDRIADGDGPGVAIAAFGYAGWAPDQLDFEIEHGSWVVIEADSKIVFDVPVDERWQLAFQRYGVDL